MKEIVYNLNPKRENLEKPHAYKVGDLVEVIPWDDDCEYAGIRLYVIGCVRDCDGTPLYVLGLKGTELYETGSNTWYNFKSFPGLSEAAIKLIKSA